MADVHKNSRVSQSVSQGTDLPLHLVPVLALIHTFPLFLRAPFAFYRTARTGTDCCIMCALIFLLLLWENKNTHRGAFSFWQNFSVMQ